MFDLTNTVKTIVDKVTAGERISSAEALELASAPLALLGMLAIRIKERKSAMAVYYNRNFHVEPTNVCVFNCRFCSYRRPADSPEAWDRSADEIIAEVRARRDSGATEVHITGGVHPRHDLHYFVDLIRRVKHEMPQATVKAFTAIELNYMIEKDGLDLITGLTLLKEAGMGSIPGGGAEIFHEEIRNAVCPEKGDAAIWLGVHRQAHQLGLPTNATMLYGHIEGWKHRIDHLDRLRNLQDETGGFNAFIPLKYRSRNNSMSDLGEVSIVEDMRTLAISRIYLDNFPHIKAYWPMFGKTTTELALAFGADDIDGTIDDTTKIYSMAGAEETSPSMSSSDMERMIRNAGYEPVERDTYYQPIK